MAQPGPAENGAPPFAPGVVEKAVKSFCATADRLVRRRCFNTAFLITKNRELAEEFSKESAMAEEEAQQIASLSETVCLQYQILGQHAPALFLFISVAAYGTKVVLCMNRLEDMAKQVAAQNRVAPETPPLPKAA